MRRLFSLVLCVMMLCSMCALGSGGSSSSEDKDAPKVVNHHYVKWRYIGNGMHTSVCDYEDCDHVRYTKCSSIKVTHDGKTISICPVCGRYGKRGGSPIWHRVYSTWDYSSSPKGDFSSLVYLRPFGEDSNVLFCASFIYRFDGAPTYFDGYTSFMFGLSKSFRHAYTSANEIYAYLTNGKKTIPVETTYRPECYGLELTIPAGSWVLVVEER